jgi:predicted HTH domain antitoxin
MNTTELVVELPLSVSETDARVLLAVKLYETGKVTLGQAAKVAEFSKRAFIELLGQHRVPVVDYSPSELREEAGP